MSTLTSQLPGVLNGATLLDSFTSMLQATAEDPLNNNSRAVQLLAERHERNLSSAGNGVAFICSKFNALSGFTLIAGSTREGDKWVETSLGAQKPTETG